jgi:lipoprotein signal peptidase
MNKKWFALLLLFPLDHLTRIIATTHYAEWDGVWVNFGSWGVAFRNALHRFDITPQIWIQYSYQLLPLLALLGLAVYLKQGKAISLPFTLLVGGLMSNLIDILSRGMVSDPLSLGFEPFIAGGNSLALNFNLADCAIIFGLAACLVVVIQSSWLYIRSLIHETNLLHGLQRYHPALDGGKKL